MANDLVQNPIVIDTTGTIYAAGQPIVIRALKLVGATTAGHSALVADANDNQFWEEVAATTNYSSTLEMMVDLPLGERTLNGLKVTIASGRLYIWKG